MQRNIRKKFSAVLDNDLPTEQQKELLESARDDADWLCRMVENLLSVTRIEDDGQGRLHTQSEAVEEVIGAAVLSFRKRHPETEVSVTVPEMPLFARMDPVLIQQVLQNLLDNASLHGVSTTRILVSAGEKDGMAVITVEDNGQGIDRRRLEHLFDGSLGSDESSDNTRSMGIGLTVCNTIIHAHGGSISASNLPQGGAHFCFTLPLGGYSDDDT